MPTPNRRRPATPRARSRESRPPTAVRPCTTTCTHTTACATHARPGWRSGQAMPEPRLPHLWKGAGPTSPSSSSNGAASGRARRGGSWMARPTMGCQPGWNCQSWAMKGVWPPSRTLNGWSCVRLNRPWRQQDQAPAGTPRCCAGSTDRPSSGSPPGRRSWSCASSRPGSPGPNPSASPSTPRSCRADRGSSAGTVDTSPLSWAASDTCPGGLCPRAGGCCSWPGSRKGRWSAAPGKNRRPSGILGKSQKMARSDSVCCWRGGGVAFLSSVGQALTRLGLSWRHRQAKAPLAVWRSHPLALGGASFHSKSHDGQKVSSCRSIGRISPRRGSVQVKWSSAGGPPSAVSGAAGRAQALVRQLSGRSPSGQTAGKTNSR